MLKVGKQEEKCTILQSPVRALHDAPPWDGVKPQAVQRKVQEVIKKSNKRKVPSGLLDRHKQIP